MQVFGLLTIFREVYIVIVSSGGGTDLDTGPMAGWWCPFFPKNFQFASWYQYQFAWFIPRFSGFNVVSVPNQYKIEHFLLTFGF